MSTVPVTTEALVPGLQVPIAPDGAWPAPPAAAPPAPNPFPGTSRLARLMRDFDWASTSLGTPEAWSPSLRTAVEICLESRFPIVLWWGPDLGTIYNDGYLPMIGNKHPWALGRPGREVWSEIWSVVGPMLAGVMERAESTWSDDLLLYLERKGFPEQSYFTFSYSPIRDVDGRVGGVFCAVAETTARVRGERRLALLRDLTAEAHVDAEEAARASSDRLAAAADDLTFAAIALHGDRPGTIGPASIGGASPIEAPGRARLRAAVVRAARSGHIERVRLGGREDVNATVIPMTDQGGEGRDVLVLGRHPAIDDDDDYRAFFELVATHVATALATARAREAERRRADALAELDRAKTVFFTNVSHEFRTPLTLLDAPLREVGDDPALAADHRHRIELAQRASGRLRRLVNTLLEFSRIEAGTSRAELHPVDVVATLDDVASVFQSAFDGAGLRLEVQGERSRPIVLADPEMLERILLNLVSNAFKFTEQGGVRMRASVEGDRALIEVADTGIGIAAEDQGRVFDRFARLDASWARSREGSGIGLALAAELARLQGGDLRVRSEVGRGTTFTLTLPLAPESVGVRTSASPERAAFADEASGWLRGGRPASSSTVEATVTAPQAVPDRRPQSARIVIVDDNADMRAYLGRVLGRHWTVDLEPDGLRALDAIRRHPPDLVLADVMMPGIDGLELVRRIRSDSRTATLPVVLLSARAGEEATAEGLAAGADEYLVKPFTAADLVVRIASRIERERFRRAESKALSASQDELRKLVARLRRNERDLTTALRVKDDFLGMVSHELRTPVTTIHGNAELLLAHADTLDPAVFRDALADIAADAERLNRVIDNLLLLARVGNDRLEAEPVLLNRVVQRVVNAALREAPERRIDIACRRGLLTTANEGAIEQILKNLVSNALKYSQADSIVTIRGRRSADGRLELSVVDRGVGLAPDESERIFEPFYRSRRVAGVPGVGIGLTVARRLAEAVGGTLTARRGRQLTTFSLTLPALVIDDIEP